MLSDGRGHVRFGSTSRATSARERRETQFAEGTLRGSADHPRYNPDCATRLCTCVAGSTQRVLLAGAPAVGARLLFGLSAFRVACVAADGLYGTGFARRGGLPRGLLEP